MIYTFIEQVILNVGNSIREEGCGIGSITKSIINHINYQYSLFDVDYDQVQLSKQNINNNKCYVGDIFKNYSKVNTIFSHGVLEHFDDIRIKQILNHQHNEANNVIHYVPSNLYSSQSFGDERLLSRQYWKSKFNPKQIIPFNNGLDLCLIW